MNSPFTTWFRLVICVFVATLCWSLWAQAQPVTNTPAPPEGAVTAAGNRLIIISETGELVAAEARPDPCVALARAQVLGGRCWTKPVLSHGRIYVRNSRGDMACVDLSR